MSLIDEISSGLGSGSASGLDAVIAGLVGSDVQPIGGVPNGKLRQLISQFEKAGLSHIVRSWVGSGANEPVFPQQLQAVFGDDRIQGMADGCSMQPQDFLLQLGQQLPIAVSDMTPDGRVPQ